MPVALNQITGNVKTARCFFLLLSRFHVIAAVLADRALVVRRKFGAVEGFEITADLADKALLFLDLYRRNIFEGVLAMLAERADIIIRHLCSLVEVTADGAAPAFLLFGDRSFLRLNVCVVVGVGRARII